MMRIDRVLNKVATNVWDAYAGSTGLASQAVPSMVDKGELPLSAVVTNGPGKTIGTATGVGIGLLGLTNLVNKERLRIAQNKAVPSVSV